MSNIYACPACERQYTVNNPGTYLCDCGAVFYCPEISDPDPKIVTQGIHRRQVLEKEPVQKLTPDKLVSKSRVALGKVKPASHPPAGGILGKPKSSVNPAGSVTGKALEATGVHSKKNLEASGSYSRSNLEGTGSFRGRNMHMAGLPKCPFAKASLFCGIAAFVCAPLAFAGIVGMVFAPFLAIFSLVLAFISKALISDPQYGRGGAGFIFGAFCAAILAIMVWGGIFFYVVKMAPAPPAPSKAIDPSKVFIPK